MGVALPTEIELRQPQFFAGARLERAEFCVGGDRDEQHSASCRDAAVWPVRLDFDVNSSFNDGVSSRVTYADVEQTRKQTRSEAHGRTLVAL